MSVPHRGDPEPAMGDYDIFVSHSHRDEKAVKRVVQRWQSWGHLVYADFKDEKLLKASHAGKMDEELANHLRKVIQHCLVFVYVASLDSVSSGWMPWELGLGHGSVGRVYLYLLYPSATQGFGNREYLQLYQKTTFSSKNAQSYLEIAVTAARLELNKPANIEAAKLMGEAIAKGGLDEAIKQWAAALQQGAATQVGIAEGGNSSVSPTFSAREILRSSPVKRFQATGNE